MEGISNFLQDEQKMTAAMKKLKVAIAGITAVIISLTAAQIALNIAMWNNPVGWVILGIAAAVAAIATIIAAIVIYWDDITAAAKRFWQWFSGLPALIQGVGKAILKALSPAFAPIFAVVDLWKKIKGGKSGEFKTMNTTEVIGDAASAKVNSTQLDVNMKIDQEGRARVASASSDAGLNFMSTNAIMVPQY
jgi:hypothetical protein